MATLLSVNQASVPCAPLSSRPASAHPATAQHAAKPAKSATLPSDFLRELHHLLAALAHK
ncbi:hypothetical protein H3H37_21875 [Duganella sp. LX20W]|uniref:Uncharacterized protein n=1 Tax=Rugamonas brunnea TaxID=2758569 RepID=A0A7W2EW52_9BURK|nr:hypothetical protein [Rugamonas brunnea]MBA5639712.1 hypothetical protein [Rugamonas brunnea]